MSRNCEARTRSQDFGSSYASTTWSCPNKATKTYTGGPHRELPVCGTHYNMLVRDHGPSKEDDAVATDAKLEISKDDLTILMRIACDGSGQPFTSNEIDFLRRIGKTYGIGARDGVEIPGNVDWGTQRGTERY